MDPVKLKKAILLFVAEFVVWLLAGIVIGAVRKTGWSSVITNGNFLLLAAVLSALSAFFDYQKGAPKK